MGQKTPNHFPEFCNQKQLAWILGVSPARISQLSQVGLPKVARGKFSVPHAVQWMIDRWREKVEGSDPDPLQQAREKLYVSQKVRTDLETAKLRRELIDAEEVKVGTLALGTIFASQLDALGGRLANQLSGMHDPAEIQSLLLREARAIRAATAEQIHELAETFNV